VKRGTVPTTSAPTVAELADRVVALCETTFAAVDGLRGVADQLLLPFSQGAPPAAADVAAIDGPVRQILDVARSPLVGAGLVTLKGGPCPPPPHRRSPSWPTGS